MGSGMQTEVSLDVRYLQGSSGGHWTFQVLKLVVWSVKVREVPSDIWVIYTFSEGLKQNAFSSLEPPE